MSAAVVRKAPNTTIPAEGGFVTQLDASFAAPPAAGNTIVALLATDNAPTSIDDNAANGAYTQAVTNSIAGARVYVHYKENIATVGGTFTTSAHFASGSFCSLGAVEVSGLATSASLVGTSVNNGSTQAVSTGSITGTGVPGIAIGLFTLTPGTASDDCTFDFTQIHKETFDVGAPHCSEYWLGTPPKNLTWTQGSTFQIWVSAGAAFAEPGAPPVTPNSIEMRVSGAKSPGVRNSGLQKAGSINLRINKSTVKNAKVQV